MHSALKRQALGVALALGIAVVLCAGPGIALASPSGVGPALDYIHACQRSDGGFAEKTKSSSSDAITAWAIVAIASAGEDPSAWTVGGHNPVQYLSTKASAWSSTTDYARTTLAVVAARKDPRSFGGVDLVAKIRADVRDKGDDGDQIGSYVNSHAWGMLALEAAGSDVSGAETKWLLRQQNSDGGWGWAPGIASDTNDTAAAVQALIVSGYSDSSSAVKRALSYLRAAQVNDGGFSYQGGAKSDADSTAWVTQALVAAGESPEAWTSDGHDPLERLRALQLPDGSVGYATGGHANPLLVTVQTLPALAKKAFPLAPKSLGAPRHYKPTVATSWPTSGASVTWHSNSLLAFDIDDGSGAGVDAGAISVTVDGTRRTATLNAQTAYVALASPSVGSHRVSVRVTDRAGNRSATRTWDFRVAAVSSAPAAGAASASATATAGSASTTAAVAAVGAGTTPSVTTPGAARGVAASVSTSGAARRGGADAGIIGTVSLIVALVSLVAAAILVGWKFLKMRR